MVLTVGVLALQGAFLEHLTLLRKASAQVEQSTEQPRQTFIFSEIRTRQQLSECDALIIPGGESTTISLVAAQSDLLDPLREFVKYVLFKDQLPNVDQSRVSVLTRRRVERKPTWGTCAGLILLAEAANATKRGGQELIGGLDVRVNRNHFGRQIESFVADLDLPFLAESSSPSASTATYPGVFIRAPIVEKLLPNLEGAQIVEQQKDGTVVAPSKQAKTDKAKSAMADAVEVMGVLPGRIKKATEAGAVVSSDDEVGDIIAVRQGNVFGTSFHPELTSDIRIHVWWLRQVLCQASSVGIAS